MNGKTEIKHRGRVSAITPEGVYVEILSKSMCAGCHAKSLCTLGDEQIKRVLIRYCDRSQYSVGEEVEVIMKQRLGLKAVLFSYINPLIILMILLLSLPGLGIGEPMSALFAILAVALYFLVLYLCGNKIAESFTFTIAKIINN